MTSNESNVPLYGLVLAGGKSVRMGTDKGRMKWYGKEQRYHVADLLSDFCDKTFISCRPEQEEELNANGYLTIPDNYEGLGPYGSLLTAFDFKSDVAWFILACDLPLIDKTSIEYLISQRDENKVSTTYRSPHDGFPETVVTIWEPKSREILIARKAEGKNCPRKALINSDTKIIEASDALSLMNANTPDDVVRIQVIISNYARRVAEI